MASKLDKLRKLHADKALTVDELDNIAGGTSGQCADDSRFLNVLLQGHPAQPDRYGEYKFDVDIANNPSRFDELEKAWNACGIGIIDIGNSDSVNRYRIYETGREVCQAEAMQYAMNKMGRHLNRSDWYWG